MDVTYGANRVRAGTHPLLELRHRRLFSTAKIALLAYVLEAASTFVWLEPPVAGSRFFSISELKRSLSLAQKGQLQVQV